MHGYSWFKNRFPRIIDSIFYFNIVFIGVVGVIIVTQYTHKLQAVSQEEVKELLDLKDSVEKEEELNLDIESLFSVRGLSLKDSDDIEAIIRQLPEGQFINQITIGNEAGMYGAYIKYDVSPYAKEINDTKIDQNILINSVVLMSLCKDLNSIDISLITDKTTEERLFYRKDIEDYLGRELSLDMEHNISYFEKNVIHFLDSKNINEYMQSNTSYKSEISTEIDKFYRANFPIMSKVKSEQMPYIPEDLGTELIEEYGHQIFVEGLKYNNEYINYYSIYRLLEFYGNEHLEEIILELEICKNNTDNKDIKLACEYVNSILTHSDYEMPMWVTRYMENNAAGGRKVYMLYRNKLQLWAEFEQPTSIDNLNTSSDNKNVWCSASSQGNNFIFVLPVQQDEPIYITPHQTVLGDIVYPEIVSLIVDTLDINFTEPNSIYTPKDILTRWYAESYLHITVSINDIVYKLIYNTKDRSLRLYNNKLQDMRIEEFLYELSSLGELLVQESISNSDDMDIKKVYIDKDYITIYEGDKNSKSMKSVKDDYLRIIDADLKNPPRTYESNKLLVSYTGDNDIIINKLNEVFKID